ncbi:MAG: HupE/UreJ family protein [Hyphomicrobiales bacterium]|nr:HupE/UreJ family protein [Hyphomicrobiales bacterium]
MTIVNHRRIVAAIFMVLLLAASAMSAFAHHMEDGEMPKTLAAGLMSGLGHPIIGLDHFAFIVGAGTASAFLARGFAIAQRLGGAAQ